MLAAEQQGRGSMGKKGEGGERKGRRSNNKWRKSSVYLMWAPLHIYIDILSTCVPHFYIRAFRRVVIVFQMKADFVRSNSLCMGSSVISEGRSYVTRIPEI